MKLLINTPDIHALGGVANHYLGLKDYWTETVRYNTVGKRSNKSQSGKYWLPWDILKFVFKLLTYRPDMVVLNPSLGRSALTRDFIFLRISRFWGFKTAVFIHGFNLDYAKEVDKTWLVSHLNRAQLIFILARQFKEMLEQWGVQTSIELTTTKVDDKLVGDFHMESRKGKGKHILFLSRVEKAKGVYITIDSYAVLKTKYPELTLTIVGDGGELQKVKEYVADRGLSDVRITGALSGGKLIDEYSKADFFSFPSYYGEGMPTAVLEAMAFGLPVFCRNVGGLPDFFEEDKMGYITNSIDPKDYVQAMIPYIENSEQTQRVSHYNAQYAKEHFMASSVARKMEQTFKKYI